MENYGIPKEAELRKMTDEEIEAGNKRAIGLLAFSFIGGAAIGFAPEIFWWAAGNPAAAGELALEMVNPSAVGAFGVGGMGLADEMVDAARATATGGDGTRSVFDVGGLQLTRYTPSGAVIGQTELYTCVSCATRMRLSDLGVPMGEGKIADALGTTTSGASIADIPDAINSLDLSVSAEYRFMQYNQFEEHMASGIPTIAGVNVPGMGSHAVLVDRIEDGQVFLRDPLPMQEGSSYSVPVSDFRSYFNRKTVTITEP